MLVRYRIDSACTRTVHQLCIVQKCLASNQRALPFENRSPTFSFDLSATASMSIQWPQRLCIALILFALSVMLWRLDVGNRPQRLNPYALYAPGSSQPVQDFAGLPRACRFAYRSVLSAAEAAVAGVSAWDVKNSTVMAQENGTQPLYMFAVTTAAADLTVNFLLSALRFDPAVLGSMVALSFSEEATKRLVAFNANASADGFGCVRIYDAGRELNGTLAGSANAADVVRYNSDIFREVAFKRYVIAERAVSRGRSVVVMDTDMILFRDVRSVLVEMQGDSDSFVGACDVIGQPQALNTGLTLLTPGNHGSLRAWLDAFIAKTDPKLNEQWVLDHMPDIQRRCLPPDVAAMLCHTKPDPSTQHLFHYNCMVTSEEKQHKMQEHGLWFVPPAPATSPPLPSTATASPVRTPFNPSPAPV